MNYQILFTDMDGTLLNDEKSISQDVLNAMTAYTNAGGQIVLSSGRPLSGILQVVNELKLHTPNMYIIAYNGAMVYDLTNDKVLMEQRVPLSIARTVLDMAHEMNIHCHTYSDTTIISEFDTQELQKYRQHVHMPYLIKKSATDYLASLDFEPFKLICITLDDHELLQKFAKKLEPAVGDVIHLFFQSGLS